MTVEPFDEFPFVEELGWPAMAATGMYDEGDFEAHFFCASAEASGLLEWYERIGVAMVDEHGRHGGCDVIDW